MNRKIIRGDIVYADLGQHPKSSVQSGIRPCVVVSNNIGNKNAKILSVCPCTGRIMKKHIPTHIELRAEEVSGYYNNNSILLVEQITVISVTKVISLVGHIHTDSELMEDINKALIRHLDISILS